MKNSKKKSVTEILKSMDDYNNHLKKLYKIRVERRILNKEL